MKHATKRAPQQYQLSLIDGLRWTWRHVHRWLNEMVMAEQTLKAHLKPEPSQRVRGEDVIFSSAAALCDRLAINNVLESLEGELVDTLVAAAHRLRTASFSDAWHKRPATGAGDWNSDVVCAWLFREGLAGVDGAVVRAARDCAIDGASLLRLTDWGIRARLSVTDRDLRGALLWRVWKLRIAHGLAWRADAPPPAEMLPPAEDESARQPPRKIDPCAALPSPSETSSWPQQRLRFRRPPPFSSAAVEEGDAALHRMFNRAVVAAARRSLEAGGVAGAGEEEEQQTSNHSSSDVRKAEVVVVIAPPPLPRGVRRPSPRASRVSFQGRERELEHHASSKQASDAPSGEVALGAQSDQGHGGGGRTPLPAPSSQAPFMFAELHYNLDEQAWLELGNMQRRASSGEAPAMLAW